MKELINTIIVDDEEKSIFSLEILLKKYCPEINIIGTAESVEQAIESINKLTPDLVFLDITMPDGDGFDVLENVDFKNFEVIFVTAYNQYALKAFEFSAIHYLLKPVDYLELQKAVKRFEHRKSKDILNEKMQVLRDSLNNKHQKIILPSFDGLEIINLDEIIRCEADSNYTIFFLTNGRKIVVSKSLNNFEKILSDIYFCRIHKKHLINLKHVKHYVKGKSGTIIMQDGSNVFVSESRKKFFIERLKEYARSV